MKALLPLVTAAVLVYLLAVVVAEVQARQDERVCAWEDDLDA